MTDGNWILFAKIIGKFAFGYNEAKPAASIATWLPFAVDQIAAQNNTPQDIATAGLAANVTNLLAQANPIQAEIMQEAYNYLLTADFRARLVDGAGANPAANIPAVITQLVAEATGDSKTFTAGGSGGIIDFIGALWTRFASGAAPVVPTTGSPSDPDPTYAVSAVVV